MIHKHVGEPPCQRCVEENDRMRGTIQQLRARLAEAETELVALRFDKGDLRAAMDLLAKPPALPASTLSGAVAFLRAQHADLASLRARVEELAKEWRRQCEWPQRVLARVTKRRMLAQCARDLAVLLTPETKGDEK